MRLMWVINDKAQSWNSQYFRDVVSLRYAIPFLKNEKIVIDVKETIFLDKAPCMNALTMQHLLKANNIDLFGKDEWSAALMTMRI